MKINQCPHDKPRTWKCEKGQHSVLGLKKNSRLEMSIMSSGNEDSSTLNLDPESVSD